MTTQDRFPIETGFKPELTIHRKISNTLLAMKPGESFIVDDRETQRRCFSVAKDQSLKITTQKVNGGGFRVWLVGKRIVP